MNLSSNIVRIIKIHQAVTGQLVVKARRGDGGRPGLIHPFFTIFWFLPAGNALSLQQNIALRRDKKVKTCQRNFVEFSEYASGQAQGNLETL